MGVSSKKFPSAIEVLLRRALKDDKPFHINALVDFYHTVSLQYVVPVGGFDLNTLHAPLEARLTRDGDLFQALDDDLPHTSSDVASSAYRAAYSCNALRRAGC